MTTETPAIERVRVRVLPDGRMTRKDTAAYLGHGSTKTLSNWATRGFGPRAIKVGGRDFYRLEEIEDFVRRGGQAA